MVKGRRTNREKIIHVEKRQKDEGSENKRR